MKKQCMHFIEKYYPNKDADNEKMFVMLSSADSLDPLDVEYTNGIMGFQFFDLTIDDDGKIGDQRVNCSPTYFFGRRITLDDVEGVYCSVDLMKNYLRAKGLKEAIFCNNGRIIQDPTERTMTIDEYRNSLTKEQEEKCVFNESDFFNGLAQVLCALKNDITYMVNDEYWPLTEDIDFDDEEENVVVRTYTIYEQEEKLISKSSIVKTKNLGATNIPTLINLNTAMEIVKPLYQEHPYLKEIMTKFRERVITTGCDDISNKLLDGIFEGTSSEDNNEANKILTNFKKPN